MWIAFRLVLAIIGFAIRYSRRRTKFDAYDEFDDGREFEGVPYLMVIRRGNLRSDGFSLRMPRRSPTWLRLHSETALDRWAKRVGLSREIQTGDARFDGLVYVTSDHPHVEKSLARSATLRKVIRRALEAGFRRVEFDGTSVVIDKKSSVGPTEGDLELLSKLHAASEHLEQDMPSRFADPFFWKALLFEGLIWALFGHAVGAILHWLREGPLFVSPREVVLLGLGVAAASFVALLSLIAFVMRGSSRGHRIVAESAVVLLIGVPIAGIQLVADTNRALDKALPIRSSVALRGCEVQEHRHKGRIHYSYHLLVIPEPSVTGDRDSFRVTSDLCTAADTAARVDFVVGPGRWSLPWYRQITVGSKSWAAAL